MALKILWKTEHYNIFKIYLLRHFNSLVYGVKGFKVD